MHTILGFAARAARGRVQHRATTLALAVSALCAFGAAEAQAQINIEDHAGLGQVGDSIVQDSPQDDKVLFRFRLDNMTGATQQVTSVRVTITAITGFALGDFSDATLVLDVNGDGAVDGGDIGVGDASSIDASGADITISFTGSPTVLQMLNGDASDFVLRADVSNLDPLDRFVAEIQHVDDVSATATPSFNGLSDATHVVAALTLADHDLAQPSPALVNGTNSDLVTYRFSLTPSAVAFATGDGTFTLNRVSFDVTATGFSGTIDDATLFRDNDGDGDGAGGEALANLNGLGITNTDSVIDFTGLAAQIAPTDVTEFVLQQVTRRLAGWKPPGTPLFHYRNGRPRARYE